MKWMDIQRAKQKDELCRIGRIPHGTLFLPVHICISTYLKIRKLRRHHRMSCDDGGMVAKGNQAESRMISGII